MMITELGDQIRLISVIGSYDLYYRVCKIYLKKKSKMPLFTKEQLDFRYFPQKSSQNTNIHTNIFGRAIHCDSNRVILYKIGKKCFFLQEMDTWSN